MFAFSPVSRCFGFGHGIITHTIFIGLQNACIHGTSKNCSHRMQTHTFTKCHKQQTNILIAARSFGRLNCRNFASKWAEVEIPQNFSEWPSIERRGINTTKIVVTYNWNCSFACGKFEFYSRPKNVSSRARARPKGRTR